ncbi:MAG: hypothetical protein KJO21_10510 [Verrucomicrobiae bacterium]|nr:hypothetical protein [Verrucomicrobiae bacterium]NNJ42715.1 hypothetical protein [Akkermansiaceae bacterium]
MKKSITSRLGVIWTISAFFLAGFIDLQAVEPVIQVGQDYQDLAEVKELTPNQAYRLGDSGVCGRVMDDHIRVTHVIPHSPADGKLQVGDRIRQLQHRGLGSNIRKMAAKRIYRLGRDWDWQLFVTVERDGIRNGKGNTLTFHLHLPPKPGGLYHFGPTGFFAKRYPDRLVVDLIEKGSPAEGHLQIGDVILAVDDKPVTGNIFQLFTSCIDHAESHQGGGRLKLRVKRPVAAGALATKPAQEHHITLQLKVIGNYSPTAPTNCPKTDAIITQAADYLVESGNVGILQSGLLALLSTGEKKYIDHVGKVLHASAFASPEVDPTLGHRSYVSWYYAYQALILTEYFLLTGDEYVLPSIKQHALTIAKGQDAAGLWNHNLADPAKNFGQLHGRLNGYGAINQTSVSLWTSLILAEKCGVKHPEVRAAIEKTHAFYSNWIGKGALPYGSHGPVEQHHTNNGTSGSIAVAYALIGNMEGARFYSRMSAAAADEILTGHTGPWWNILWSGLGANVAGPEVTAAYNQKIHWLRTVTRSWDGRFLGMLAWGVSPKPGRLCDTSPYLMNYCAGRRAIHITGKGMDPSLWLTGQTANDSPEVGAIGESQRDADSLLTLLGSPLPRVRHRAAEHLAILDADVADQVMKLLAKGNHHQRIGAIHAIGQLKITEAAGALVAIVQNDKDHVWIRQLAAKKLAEMDEAKPHGPELIKVLIADKPYDPIGNLDRDLGVALVKILGPDPYALSLDKDLFYSGVTKLLHHKHMLARGAGMALIKNIPIDDLPRMIDQIVYIIEDKDRSYIAYAGRGRQEGLEILNRHNIKEVIDLTIKTINEPTGRRGPRVRARIQLLKTFGAEAIDAIPQIKEALGGDADEIITQIENSQTPRKMISIEEMKQAGGG